MNAKAFAEAVESAELRDGTTGAGKGPLGHRPGTRGCPHRHTPVYPARGEAAPGRDSARWVVKLSMRRLEGGPPQARTGSLATLALCSRDRGSVGNLTAVTQSPLQLGRGSVGVRRGPALGCGLLLFLPF